MESMERTSNRFCYSVEWENSGGCIVLLLFVLPAIILNIRIIVVLIRKLYHVEMIVIFVSQILTASGKLIQSLIYLASIHTCVTLGVTYVIEKAGVVTTVCTLVIMTAKDVFMTSRRDPDGEGFRGLFLIASCCLYIIVGIGLTCLPFLIPSTYAQLFHVVYHFFVVIISTVNCFQAAQMGRKVRVYEANAPAGNIFALKVEARVIRAVAIVIILFELYSLFLQCIFITCHHGNTSSSYCNAGKWLNTLYCTSFTVVPLVMIRLKGLA